MKHTFWSQWITTSDMFCLLGVWCSCATIATACDRDADRSCVAAYCDTNVPPSNNSKLAAIHTFYGCRNYHWAHTDIQYGNGYSGQGADCSFIYCQVHIVPLRGYGFESQP